MKVSPVPYRRVTHPCIHHMMVDILAGMALPNRPPQLQAARPASPQRAHARLRPQREPGRDDIATARGSISMYGPTGSRGLGAAPHDPGPPNRAWARRIPPRLAEGSAREGVREPEAGPRRWRPPGREAAGRVRCPPSRRRRGRSGTSCGRAGRSPQHAQLWLKSLERYAIPPHRGDTDCGSDERRRDRDSRSDLARHAAHRPEIAPAHPRGHGVGPWRWILRPDNPCDRIGPVLGAQGGACPAHAGVAAR